MSLRSIKNITLNQPAVGETLPTQPVINQLVQGIPTVQIQPIFAEGWPTTFESTTKQYRFRATYRAVVPVAGPTYVWEFVHIPDVAWTSRVYYPTTNRRYT